MKHINVDALAEGDRALLRESVEFVVKEMVSLLGFKYYIQIFKTNCIADVEYSILLPLGDQERLLLIEFIFVSRSASMFYKVKLFCGLMHHQMPILNSFDSGPDHVPL